MAAACAIFEAATSKSLQVRQPDCGWAGRHGSVFTSLWVAATTSSTPSTATIISTISTIINAITATTTIITTSTTAITDGIIFITAISH